MTLNAWPIFAGAIVIDASNNAIRFKEGASTVTVTVASGTYFILGDGTASDLLAAVKTAIDGAGATNTYGVTILFDRTAANVSAAISIARTVGAATFQFLWGDALTTFVAAYLGFTQVNTADSTATKVSTQSPRALWVSDQPYAALEPIKQRKVFANRAQSGIVKGGARTSTWQVKRLDMEAVSSFRTNDGVDTGDTERTFDAFLDYVGDGKQCRLYLADFETSATSALIGTLTFTCEFSQESIEEFAPKRLEPGAALYDFSVTLWKHIT